jgi:hypothetical protein
MAQFYQSKGASIMTNQTSNTESTGDLTFKQLQKSATITSYAKSIEGILNSVNIFHL